MARNAPIKPIEQYEHHYEQFSDAFRDDVADRVTDSVDGFLMQFSEPKGYAEVRTFTQAIVDTVLLWAVTEGYLTLPEEYTATEEEKGGREAKRAERVKKAQDLMERIQRQAGGPARPDDGGFRPGTYL